VTTSIPSPTAEKAAPDLGAVLSRMRAAERNQRAPNYDQRVAGLERLERTLLSRQGSVVAAISQDFGNRSRHESLVGEVLGVLSGIRHTRAHLRDWMEREERDVNWVFAPSTAEVIPQPLGVVGIISPWNYPVLLSLSPLVSALSAGNRVMIKPSELAPETAALLGDLLAEAFPDDQVAVLTGGRDVGEAFSHLPFDHLLFTGSTRVGKLVMRAASENLVPVTLELGGKSPAVVSADFPLSTAADRIMAGKLFNAGQTCIAPDYALVPGDVRDRFVEACRASVAKMYPTLERNPDYTTIINDDHLARLARCVDDAKARGATVVECNPASEMFTGTRKMAPTLVLGATEDMLLIQEEIFGPVLPVLTYGRLDEAIAYVNDHPRPLALYVFSHHRATVERFLSETTSGAVTVNETLLHCMQDDLPFGGVGPSGMGHYHGREGFETFTKKKPVFRHARLSARGLLLPPYGRAADGVLRVLVR
jgi:coniferyl-aldehyde dehydrogenase